MRIGLSGLSLLAIILWAVAPAIAEPKVRMSEFSGKPVPRFESLKFSAVNGRGGPSFDHPIRWTYERTGLPMLILKESYDWRRVRDPSGEEVWVHARTLSTVPTGMVDEEVTLKASPGVEAAPVAILQAGTIIEIKRREDGWLKVEIEGMRGWVARDQIWGGMAAMP